jgi:hypothetical protein
MRGCVATTASAAGNNSRYALLHTQNMRSESSSPTSQVGKEGSPPRDSAGVTLLSWTVDSDIGSWITRQAAGLKPPSLLKHAEVEAYRFSSNLRECIRLVWQM